MAEFKESDSLGAQPLEDQVAYLIEIGDIPEARWHIDQFFKFVPQIEGMRAAVSSFIKDERIPREERVEVWMKTPDQLTTIAQFMTELQDEELEKVCPDWIIKADVRRNEECDLRGLIGWCEFEDPEVEKALVDMCLKQGIHGFVMDW